MTNHHFTPVEEVLAGDIMKHPEDPLPCFAMADSLAERGLDDMAFAFRWMGRTGRRPGHRTMYTGSLKAVPDKFSWGWVNQHATNDPSLRGHSFARALLPVWIMLAGEDLDHVYFPSWLRATQWLASALAIVRKGMDGP